MRFRSISLRLSIAIAALSFLFVAPLQGDARGHGGGHARSYTPRSYTPRSYTPRSYTPRSYTPRSYTPRSHTPRSFTPRSFTPRSYTPRSHSPRSYAPDSTGAETGRSYRHHSANWLNKYSSNLYVAHGGREHRSLAEKHMFWEQSGHPHGWPGHVVDHVIPLACGGADAPSNMQWQTTAAAKAKDKWERKGCKRH